RAPDGARLVGAVNSISFAAQAYPAGPDRTLLAGRNNHVRVVVGGIGDAIDDLEFAARARTGLRSHGHAVKLHHFTAFQQRQLAVRNADQYYPLSRRRTRPRSPVGSHDGLR